MTEIRYYPGPNERTVSVGYNTPLPVTSYPSTTAADAFGRLRVSSPQTLFDAKQIHDNAPLYFDDQQVSGSGTGSSHSTARASSIMSVSATTAGRRVRQSFQRLNYQPGKSQLILCTGILTASGGGSGIFSAMGYYDDSDGVFIEADDGTIGFTIRSSVSGSPVDNTVAQSDWNGDTMDGTGKSGVTLNPAAAQIVWFDIEWLGVGSVRCGFVVDGQFIVCHTFHHANSVSSVYMATPNLPIRYELVNDGTGAASTLEHICNTVISEGGVQPKGKIRYVSTAPTHVDANAADTVYALIGLRLKSTHLDQQVDLLKVSVLSETNDSFEWVIKLNPTVAGTFTYGDVSNSALQVATGATANTVTGGTDIDGDFVSTVSRSASQALENAIRLGSYIDGTRTTIVLCARPFSSNADIQGAITWRELN